MNLRKMRKHAELCRSSQFTVRVSERDLDDFFRAGTPEEEIRAWIHSLVPPLRPGPRVMYQENAYATSDKIVTVKSWPTS